MATPPPGSVSLWRHRNFRYLLIGQTAGEVASRFSSVALPIVAVKVLQASVFEVSALTALAWVPYLIFSLPAGVIADRVDWRRLMIGCDLGRMMLIVSLPVVAYVSQLTLWYLYVVVGLSGLLTVLFNVAYRSALPRLVAAEQLVEGNAKLTMGQDSAELVGPSIGGALITLVGAVSTFLGNGLAYLVSAFTLMRIRPDATAEPAHGDEDDDKAPLRTQLTEGLAFIRRQPILMRILACTTTSNFFVMAAGGIEVTFMVRELGATEYQVGLVFSISAIGGLVVGAFASRLSKAIGNARIIWVAMAAPGPLYLFMPLAQHGWGVLLFGVGLAAFSANAVLYNVAATSYQQHITPARILGRVNASFMWVCLGVIPLGALFGGVLGTGLGLRGALWVCVMGTWSAALFVVFSPLRRMRDVPAAAP